MSDLTPFVSAGLTSTGTEPPGDPDEFLIVRETFIGAGSGGFNDYWNDEVLSASDYTPNTAQEPFPLAASLGLTPPSGNARVMNYFYKSGVASDHTPIQLARIGDTFIERFVRWSELYTAAGAFIWPQSQKLCRMGNTTGSGQTVDFVPISTNGSPDQVFTLLGYDVQTASTMFGDSNCPLSGFIAEDVWHEYVAYFRKATAPNVANGRALFMIDGVAVCDRQNIVTHTSDTYPYNFLWVGGNNTWNGNGPGGYTSVPQNQNRYIDNPEVYSGVPTGVTLP